MQILAETIQNHGKATLGGIFWGKALNFIANNSMLSIGKKAMEFAAGLLLGALAVAPSEVTSIGQSLLKTQNYAIVKVAIIFTIWRSRKIWLRVAKKILRWVKMPAPMVHEKLIDGIPVSELADYLIRNGNFKREGLNGVRATFGLRMEKFNRLAGRLEEHGVLIRGENNLRKLAPRWSRQALIDFLSQSENSKNMGPWIRVHRIGENAKVRLDRQEIAA